VAFYKKHFKQRRVLERAKGFEPSTPTLAKSGSCLLVGENAFAHPSLHCKCHSGGDRVAIPEKRKAAQMGGPSN